MKVLQINKYPSRRGGTETVLFKTIDLLKQYNHDVVLYSTNEGDIVHKPTYVIPYLFFNASVKDKIKYVFSFIYNRKAKKELKNILEKERPDIAHIHLYLNCFSVSILPVLKKYKIPVVMTLHDYRQICPSYLLLDKEKQICIKCKNKNYLNCMFSRCSKGSLAESAFMTIEMYFRRWFYKTENYVDKFVFVSRRQFQIHEEFKSKIVDNAVVIYNSVETPPDFSVSKGNYILYLGRLSREKGVDTLLTVMSRIPDVTLKVAGVGIETYENIPDNVEFVGFKAGAELEDLVKNASFVVVPSEWYEPFGLSCLEALALGTPVIASEIGALPEMIEDRKNGFLFKPGDCAGLEETISKALSLTSEEYESMSLSAYESAKKFSDQIYIDRLLEVYNSVLRKK